MVGFNHGGDVLPREELVGHASGHRRADAERLVDAPEVVEHEIQCEGVEMVLGPLLNASVSRVNRRICIRIVRFDRST